MNGSDSEEEGKKNKKKDKNKKQFFRIDRAYLLNKIQKKAKSYYQVTDQETGLNKFK